MNETMLVYDDGHLLHQPGPNPGTQYTACMVDAGEMKRTERPITWAGIWCSDCLRAVAQPPERSEDK